MLKWVRGYDIGKRRSFALLCCPFAWRGYDKFCKTAPFKLSKNAENTLTANFGIDSKSAKTQTQLKKLVIPSLRP